MVWNMNYLLTALRRARTPFGWEVSGPQGYATRSSRRARDRVSRVSAAPGASWRRGTEGVRVFRQPRDENPEYFRVYRFNIAE